MWGEERMDNASVFVLLRDRDSACHTGRTGAAGCLIDPPTQQFPTSQFCILVIPVTSAPEVAA